MLESTPLAAVVHVIQTSLTPIFLLGAVASLLGVFATRLARVADQVKTLVDKLHGEATEDPLVAHRLVYLKRRTHALDAAVILASIAGACTCATVLTLFLGLVRAKATESLLLILFGAAVLCTVGALAAFLTEVLLASRGIRAEVADHFERLEL